VRAGALEATARTRYDARRDVREFGDAPSPHPAGCGLSEGKRLISRTTCDHHGIVRHEALRDRAEM
jgi:hypothetical protein